MCATSSPGWGTLTPARKSRWNSPPLRRQRLVLRGEVGAGDSGGRPWKLEHSVLVGTTCGEGKVRKPLLRFMRSHSLWGGWRGCRKWSGLPRVTDELTEARGGEVACLESQGPLLPSSSRQTLAPLILQVPLLLHLVLISRWAQGTSGWSIRCRRHTTLYLIPLPRPFSPSPGLSLCHRRVSGG